MKKLKLHNKRKLILLGLVFLFLALFIIYMIFNVGEKKESSKKATDKKITSKTDKWFSPGGDAGVLNIYKSDYKNVVITVRKEDYNQAVSAEDFRLVSEYKCTTSSCKWYGASPEMGYVIIKDAGYYIYDYEKKLAKKLDVLDAEYNSMEFLTYEGKVYGLAVSNIHDLYAFYSLDNNAFTTDFIYQNIYSFDTACLIKGYFIAALTGDEGLKYYLVDYKTGERVRRTDGHMGAFGNGDHVYYYENFSDDSSYYAQLYNDFFMPLLDEKHYDMFAVSKAGNLAIKNEDNTFSIYNSNGTLIKSSKKYKQILKILNDYVVVIDNDGYLKLTDYDSNVVAKFLMMDDYFFDNTTSGAYVNKGKKFIYADVQNISNGEKQRYYYDLQTHDSGVLKLDKS